MQCVNAYVYLKKYKFLPTILINVEKIFVFKLIENNNKFHIVA